MVKKRKVYIVFMLVYRMGIEKYIGKVRTGLNAGARGLGNMVYDGLGDSLSSDVNLKKNTKKGVAALTLLGIVGLNSGCVTPAGNRFGKNLVRTYIRTSVVRNAKNRSDAQYRQVQRVRANPSVEYERKLVVQYWKDFNGNGKLDSGENLGDVDGPVDLSKYGLRVKLETASDEPITFFALDSEGNRLSPPEKDTWNDWINGSSNDWIKNLHTAGKNKADRYTVYAQQEGCSKVFKKSITTVRNRKNLSAK